MTTIISLRRCAALGCFAFVSTAAHSQQARDLATQRFEIDPMHSTVGFASTILGAVKVRGRFKSYNGTVIYDAQRPERSSVSVIIQAASISTDMSFRDDHLRSPDFFDVKRFPTIEFVSDHVRPTKDGAIISGNLTMHGVSKRVALPAKLVLAPRLVGTTPNAAFSAEIVLSRKDFGIAGTNKFNPDFDPVANMLSDSVAVLLELAANRDSFVGRVWGRGTPPGVADTVDRVLRAKGIDAAIVRYRDLRATQPTSFNFGADQLDGLGRQLAEQGRIADALALLSLNAEIYPKTRGVLEGLGETQVLANDASGALVTYRRALAQFPNSTSAREMVRHLASLDAASPRRGDAQRFPHFVKATGLGNGGPIWMMMSACAVSGIFAGSPV
jgi:polyisoprenoid-binding protein YceI